MKNKLDLDLSKIYKNYQCGNLDRENFSNILITIIDNIEDEEVRIKSTQILGEISKKNRNFYKLFEYIFISDSNLELRKASLNVLTKFYINKSIPLLKWALQNESSPRFLSDVIIKIKNIDIKLLHGLIIDEFKLIIEDKVKLPDKWLISYYKKFFNKNPIIHFPLHQLIDLFLNYKIIVHFEHRYNLTENYRNCIISSGYIVDLELTGFNIDKIPDIDGLEFLIKLDGLDLSGNNITKIEGLNSLKKLGHLKFGNLHYNIGNNITEIDGLKDLVELKSLDLSLNPIKEIKNLDNLVNLGTLILVNTSITEIKGLDNLHNLGWLCLSSNKISEIKGLDNLKNLHQLDLAENQIKNIKGLKNLKNLTELELANNHITTLENIEHLINLRTLSIENNQISKIFLSEKLNALSAVNGEGNIIPERELIVALL